MQQKIAQKLYLFSFLFTSLTIALTPLFFLPVFSWASGGSKIFIFTAGAFLSFMFWVLSQFSEGVVTFRKRRALGVLWLWQAFLAVGIFFSANAKLSLWGRGVSTDSLVVLFSFSLIVFLVAQFASEKKKALTLFFGIISSLSLVLVLQILFFAFRNIPIVSKLFGFVATSGTLVGSWTDFSYVLLFLYGMALVTYEMYAPSRIIKKASLFIVILSLIAFLFVNIKLAWIFVLGMTIVLFLYKMISHVGGEYTHENPEGKKFPSLSFVSLLISLFFLLSSPLVSGFFARTIGFSFNDVRPSFVTSLNVAKDSVRSTPIFGNGMGTYQDVWDMYKPGEINDTAFWNTSFPSSFNFFLTAIVTQGVIAFLLGIVFVGSLLLLIKRTVTTVTEDGYMRWIRALGIFGTILFICLLFIHAPSISLFALGAWAVGLLLVAAPEKEEPFHVVYYLQDPRKSFFALSGMLIGTLISFAVIFYSINLFIGSIIYSSAITTSSTPNAINKITSALQINQNDVYHRVRASLLLSEFNARIRTQDADVVLAQSIYREAIEAARQSTLWNRSSAINWLLLSQIYQVGATGENTTFYEEAKKAGEEALKRNPLNPVLELNMAQVALTQKKLDEANDFIARAKEKKVDYIDAYLLQGQVKSLQGDQNGFISEITAFLEKAPSSPDGYAYLAQAYAEQKKYDEAIRASVRSVQLDPVSLSRFGAYINLLETAGKKERAITELESFKAAFPRVTGVDEKIAELRNTSSSEALTPEISLEDKKE